MTRVKLDGSWSVKLLDSKVAETVKKGDAFTSGIPIEIHDSLYSSGVIEDPYFAKSYEKQRWINTSSWTIDKDFDIESKDRYASLMIPPTDGVARVFLNGEELSEKTNELRNTYIDITDKIKENNTLSLLFESTGREYKSPELLDIKPIGIFKAPEVILYSACYAKSISVFAIEEGDYWRVYFEADIFSYEETRIPISLTFLKGELKDILEIFPGEKIYSKSLLVKKDDIETWTLGGMGKQHVYSMSLTLGESNYNKQFAFRKVRLVNDGNEISFYINDKKAYIKGVTFNPLDILPSRISRMRYERLMELSRDSHINLIKVMGNGRQSEDDLYSECDRLGILIMQELSIPESTSEEDIPIVIKDIKEEVRRLKDHPSIASWSIKWDALKRINDNYTGDKREKELSEYSEIMSKVKEAILSADPYRPILDGNETLGEKMDLFMDDPISEINSHRPRFVSSLSFPSLPSRGEALSFVDEKDLNISTEAFESHSKDKRAIKTIISSFAEYFRFPSSFDEMSYLSEGVQATLYDRAISLYRTQAPYNSGIILSSLNESYPSVSDSIVEYTGHQRLASYMIKRSFQPLVPILYIRDNKLLVYVSNDSYKKEDINLKVKFRNYNGFKWETFYFTDEINEMESKKVGEINLKNIDTKNIFCYAQLKTGSIIREKTHILTLPKYANLENPNLNMEISRIKERDFNIKIRAEKPAFWVSLDQGSIKGSFSDNFIAVRPSSEKNIIFHSKEDIDENDFKAELSLFDLYSSSRCK